MASHRFKRHSCYITIWRRGNCRATQFSQYPHFALGLLKALFACCFVGICPCEKSDCINDGNAGIANIRTQIGDLRASCQIRLNILDPQLDPVIACFGSDLYLLFDIEFKWE